MFDTFSCSQTQCHLVALSVSESGKYIILPASLTQGSNSPSTQEAEDMFGESEWLILGYWQGSPLCEGRRVVPFSGNDIHTTTKQASLESTLSQLFAM